MHAAPQWAPPSHPGWRDDRVAAGECPPRHSRKGTSLARNSSITLITTLTFVRSGRRDDRSRGSRRPDAVRRAGTGARWRRIGRQRLGDRRHRRSLRGRARRDHGRSHHRDLGRSNRRRSDHQRRSPNPAARRHPRRPTPTPTRAPATDPACDRRIRPAASTTWPGFRPHGDDDRHHCGGAGCRRHAPPHGCRRPRARCRPGCAPPRSAGGRSPPPGCRAMPGHSGSCASRWSMPGQACRSCSTAAAGSSWWTPSPPARRTASACRRTTSGDERYIDGGYRRNENADLAVGYARVLVLSPFGGRSRHPAAWGMDLATQVAELRAGGSRVETVFPGDDAGPMMAQCHGRLAAPGGRPSRMRSGQGPRPASGRLLALRRRRRRRRRVPQVSAAPATARTWAKRSLCASSKSSAAASSPAISASMSVSAKPITPMSSKACADCGRPTGRCL